MEAARRRLAKLEEALGEFPDDVPDRDALLAAIKEGKKGSAIPRAEPAPSGRAGCLACSEKIKKGELRIVVEREVDTGSFVAKRPGYLHAGCAKGSEHLEGVEDLRATLEANSDLNADQLAALAQALG